MGFTVAVYTTSSPSKNLCSPSNEFVAKSTLKSVYALLWMNPLIFASHLAPIPFPPDIVTEGVVA